ncbi:RDD family protein [Amycolatopsis sp. H20-H5]|uniref:RDD family protein n=1 Tax=Amycolatopsis sp. H20-H5 TaxID=3046309 RepID=UPI002DBA8C42|nr:RDD family protein [Amycolatopsis sp. H20-H5]MEC3977208.1 RDD family protein [Amycolatopsis sp. H20-H5]
MTNPYGQQPFGQPPGGQQQPGYGQPYGQPAPYGYPGQPPFGGLRQDYANWGQRAGAYLIDLAPMLGVMLVGYLVMIGSNIVGGIIVVIGLFGGLGWTIYNRWIQGGNTGQSLGKRVLKIKLLKEETGQPLGAGMAFVRDLAHFVDNVACYLGWLWPAWDPKSQTFSDKIVGTIVVNVDPAAQGNPYGAQQQPYGQPLAPYGAQPAQPASPFGAQPGQAPQGGYGQAPQSGGFPQQPQPGGFGQPQQGGFGQPQPGQPQQGGYGQPPQSGGFAQQPQPPQPGTGPQQQPPESAFDSVERTQMIQPGGTPDETQKIPPNQQQQ